MNRNHSVTVVAAALMVTASLGGCAPGPRYQISTIGAPSSYTQPYAADSGVVDGVRLDNGGYLTVTQDTPAELRIGDRVRIENGQVHRY